VEEKYGGTAANVVCSWPPEFPHGVITAPHTVNKSFEDITVSKLNDSSFMDRHASIERPFANMDLLLSEHNSF